MKLELAAQVAPDVSVVLLDARGKVASDDDFVFWNAPSHPSRSVVIEDITMVDTNLLPETVDSVAVILSTFEGSSAGTLHIDDTEVEIVELPPGQASIVLTAHRSDRWAPRTAAARPSDLETLLVGFGVDVGDDEPGADDAALGHTAVPEPVGRGDDPVTEDGSGPGAAGEPETTTPVPDKPKNRSRRIRRSAGGMQLTKDLSADEANLLALLPHDGSTSSRATLLARLGEDWRASRFYAARDSLVERGLAASVRGRGGGLQRVATEDDVPVAASVARYANEASLYQPMRRVLENDWAQDHGFEPIRVEITAAQGRRATGGTWTRPDVVLTQVRVFDYLPGKYLEVITFEIKPRTAINVLAVYEAVSHRRSATRSYVIFHVPSAETAGTEQQLSAIADVARQHGVGMIIAGDPADYSTWEDRVDAEHWDPDPGRLNLFIKTQLSADTKAKIIRQVR